MVARFNCEAPYYAFFSSSLFLPLSNVQLCLSAPNIINLLLLRNARDKVSEIYKITDKITFLCILVPNEGW
jgi:hypothetical protein